MSKLLNKTVKKLNLWAIVCAVIMAAGLIAGIIFGFNTATTASSVKTVTVQLNSYAGDTETADLLATISESKFKAAGLKEKYMLKSEIADGNIYELVYVFDEKTADSELKSAKSAIEAEIEAKEEAGELGTAFVGVTLNDEKAIATVANGFVWRGILAGAVLLAVVFVYTAIRFKWLGGALVTGATLAALLLTTAVTALARVPVTATFAYAAAFSALFAASLAVLVVGAASKAFKENQEKSSEENLISSVPTKEILTFTAVLAAAVVLVGMVSTTAVQWFAVTALIAIACGLFVALFLLPAAYLPLRKAADRVAAKKARYDYKKGE